MERVVNVLGKVTEDRDTEVKHEVLESAVLDEEVNVEQLELTPCEEVPKVRLVFRRKLMSFWALYHQDQMRHFN
jgi:hypothetical protein